MCYGQGELWMEPEVWKRKLQGLFSPLRLYITHHLTELPWAFQNLIKITSGHSNFPHTWKKGDWGERGIYFIRLSPEARLIILETTLNNLLFPEWEISTSVFNSVLVSVPLSCLLLPHPPSKPKFQCYFPSVSFPVLLYTWKVNSLLDIINITMNIFNSNQQVFIESLDV